MAEIKRVCIVTATRAEYGLLTPLIRRIHEDDELELDLIVTGAHLSEKQGMTISEIRAAGFPIAHEIPILEEDNTPYGISLTMANAIKGFAECFRDDRPDMVVILGDRTEMLGVASAVMNERIPIAHICGGEATEGAVDDCVRHALTKMSYLHFTETEAYRRRVIQLGESPDRVFNVGSLGAENILTATLLNENEIRKELNITENKPYIVVTFHPVTLEDVKAAEKQARALCDALEQETRYDYIITRANADAGGDAINRIFERFSEAHDHIRMVDSLGMIRYLSAVKYAAFVLGNSSSGITEAPILGTPTVNIGDRQKGRLMAETIVQCIPETDAIRKAMHKAAKVECKPTDLYGDGRTSEKIIGAIKNRFDNNKIELKKRFHDLGFVEG